MTNRKLHRKFLASLTLAALALLSVAQLLAQASPPSAQAAAPASPHDIADVWQGTLHAGQDLRTVIKITKDDKGAYKGVFYTLDQSPNPFNLDTVTLQGSDVKFALKMFGLTYEGKLTADGKTIEGSSTQGGNALPLVLTRATKETAWDIPAPQPPPKPMAANADPSFEVATIKPNDSGATSMQALILRGRNFMTRASSLGDLIAFAYQVQAKQIVNAPDWIYKDRYDIAAVPDQEGSPNPEQVRIMIRKLLTERFKLTFHHDQRDLSAYTLSVGKGGQKLDPTQSKSTLPGLFFRPAPNGVSIGVMNASIGDFTEFLQSQVLDRPVVDKTALTGRYDFQCTFTPDDSQFGGHPPQVAPAAASSEKNTADAAVAAAPSLYEAMQEQLGLKLAAEKTSVDVIAIDHVEKPSAN